MPVDSSSKSPKYKSIDDILEALKDQSVEDEVNSSSTPSDVKTARELQAELEAKNEQLQEKESDETEEKEVEEKSDDDDPLDREDNPPQKSHVFGHEDVDDSEDTEEKESFSETDSSSGEESALPEQDKPNVDPQSLPPEEIHHQAADPVEHTLDDLVSEEPISSEFEAEQPHIPKITPHSNLSTFHHSTSPKQHDFNTQHQFDYTHDRPTNKLNKLHILILGLIGVAVITGAVYFLKNPFSLPNQQKEAVTQSPIPVPTATPMPVSTPLERSEYKVRVLNGTTKTGLAGEVLKKLKDLGYQTAEKGSNATNSAFLTTMVRVKESDSSLSAQIIKDLVPDYEAVVSVPLKSSDQYNAEVILGQK